MQTKLCRDCNIVKPVSEFRKRYGRSAGTYYPYCKSCYHKKCGQTHKAANATWRAEHPEEIRQLARESYQRLTKSIARQHTRRCSITKRTYGLTEEQLQDLLKAQQGCCKICGADFGTFEVANKNVSYVIDHDHATGEVRGLLCIHCNTMIGRIEKTKAPLDKINEYLQRR